MDIHKLSLETEQALVQIAVEATEASYLLDTEFWGSQLKICKIKMTGESAKDYFTNELVYRLKEFNVRKSDITRILDVTDTDVGSVSPGQYGQKYTIAEDVTFIKRIIQLKTKYSLNGDKFFDTLKRTYSKDYEHRTSMALKSHFKKLMADPIRASIPIELVKKAEGRRTPIKQKLSRKVNSSPGGIFNFGNVGTRSNEARVNENSRNPKKLKLDNESVEQFIVPSTYSEKEGTEQIAFNTVKLSEAQTACNEVHHEKIDTFSEGNVLQDERHTNTRNAAPLSEEVIADHDKEQREFSKEKNDDICLKANTIKEQEKEDGSIMKKLDYILEHNESKKEQLSTVVSNMLSVLNGLFDSRSTK